MTDTSPSLKIIKHGCRAVLVASSMRCSSDVGHQTSSDAVQQDKGIITNWEDSNMKASAFAVALMASATLLPNHAQAQSFKNDCF
jgi:hypothetical protein